MSLSTPTPKVNKIAFARQNVGSPSKPGSANISHMFLYRTAHTLAQVLAAGYFNDVRGRLTTGSIITAIVACDGVSTVDRIDLLVGDLAAANDVVVKSDTGAGDPARTSVIQIPVQLADLANGQTLKAKVPFNFKVVAAQFRVAKAATTASKLATLTPGIAGVAMTGGVMALTSANCTPAGAAVAGTAITALNDGNKDDTVEVAVSAVTAFVEGDGWVEFTVLNKDL